MLAWMHACVRKCVRACVRAGTSMRACFSVSACLFVCLYVCVYALACPCIECLCVPVCPNGDEWSLIAGVPVDMLSRGLGHMLINYQEVIVLSKPVNKGMVSTRR